jgi:hypothetical protein
MNPNFTVISPSSSFSFSIKRRSILNKEWKLRQSWRDTHVKTLPLRPTKTGIGTTRMDDT